MGTSYGGGRVPDDAVCAASDFILLHGNGMAEPARIAAMVDQTRALPAYAGQPIACTEDDHFAFDRPDNNFHGSAVGASGLGILRSRPRPVPRQLHRRLPERAGELGHQHAAQAQVLRPAAAGNRRLTMPPPHRPPYDAPSAPASLREAAEHLHLLPIATSRLCKSCYRNPVYADVPYHTVLSFSGYRHVLCSSSSPAKGRMLL